MFLAGNHLSRWKSHWSSREADQVGHFWQTDLLSQMTAPFEGRNYKVPRRPNDLTIILLLLGSSHLGAMSKRGKRQSTRHGDGGTFEVLWTNWNRLVLADPTPVKILVVVEGRSQRNTSTVSSL